MNNLISIFKEISTKYKKTIAFTEYEQQSKKYSVFTINKNTQFLTFQIKFTDSDIFMYFLFNDYTKSYILSITQQHIDTFTKWLSNDKIYSTTYVGIDSRILTEIKDYQIFIKHIYNSYISDNDVVCQLTKSCKE
jgi:hypothetical protein